MKFDYKINESDYLDFQLYTVSKSERFLKKQQNGKYFLAFCSSITTAYFIYSQDKGMAAYFGLTTVAFLLLYPTYFKWRQKVHYTKFIRRNYRDLFGQSETLEINGKNISLKNETGEGQIKKADIDKLIETTKHFFIQLSAGSSLIISKNEMNNSEAFLREFKKINVPIEIDLQWKW